MINSKKPTKCKACNIEMRPGIAIVSTTHGIPDFPGGEVLTMSQGGPGRIVEVMKCPQCGRSLLYLNDEIFVKS